MEENKLEELFRKYNDEMKCHMIALNEDFQSKLSAIAEGVTLLNEKVDRVETTQNAHTEMIGIIAEDVAVLKEDVSEIKTELKNKVSRPEFVELKQTVLAMS